MDDSAGGETCSDFLDAIRRNMDPDSNTVLLVDDEKGIRKRVAREVLGVDPSIIVYEASDGREALEKIEEIRHRFYRDPAFIVLDLNMPVMDGWEVIDALKKDYEGRGKTEGIPIIVLSSTSGEKGGFLRKQSVHKGESGYTPLVAVAKEACVEKSRYGSVGREGLLGWLQHFVGQE